MSGAGTWVPLYGDSKRRHVEPGRLCFPPLQHSWRVWSQAGRSIPAPQAGILTASALHVLSLLRKTHALSQFHELKNACVHDELGHRSYL